MRHGLIALALLCCLAAPGVAEEAPTAWDDDAFLQQALSEAIPLVEQVCEATFPERPKLATATAEDLEAILVVEMGGIFKKFGADSEAGARMMAKALAGALAAKYEPATKTIHVSPDNIRRLVKVIGAPELASKEMIRALLVHEAAHALDFMRFPTLETERQTRETKEGVQVVGAVLEGHAQFVAEEAAKITQAPKGFEQFTRLILSQRKTDDPAERMAGQVFSSEIRFAYGKGHAFVRAVHEARGRKGLDALLARPPSRIREIERPALYLDPEAARQDRIDFTPVLDSIEKALKAEGHRTMRQRLMATLLTGVYAPLGPERAEAVAAKFQDGWSQMGSPGPGKLMVVALLAFETEADAEAYLEEMEALLHAKEAQLKDNPSATIEKAEYSRGVGRNQKRPGLFCRQTIRERNAGGGSRQIVTVHGARVGRVAIELSGFDAGWPREQEDALLETVMQALGAAPVDTPEPAGAGADR